MKYKIPKVIHYIWLGTRKLDKTSVECMKTWKKYLPDYEIKKWGDEECKEIINGNLYAKQAYCAKKFAFVSDYLRVYILYNYGGVYMDTDVQIYKNIDCFLQCGAFTSFEDEKNIPTALMASAKGNEWMKMLLDDYNHRKFINEDGSMDTTTNVDTITRLSLNWGLIQNGKEQVLRSDVHIYPHEYFCPIDLIDERKNAFTKNTYAAHLFSGSWQSPLRRKLSRLKKKLGIDPEKIFGKKITELLRKI